MFARCIRARAHATDAGNGARGALPFTQYFIDAPGITPDLPRQYRMPTLVLMTPAEELPALFENWDRSRSDDGLTTQNTSPVLKPDKSRSPQARNRRIRRIRNLSENRTRNVKTCLKSGQVS